MRVFLRIRRDWNRVCRIIEHLDRCSAPLPRDLALFVLLLEDKRFMRHHGVDPIASIRAGFNVLRGRPRGGASTIDMQLVRTITNYRARTITRKLYEATLALAVRRTCRPEAILKAYLSIAYMGTGMVGIGGASRRLFSCDPAHLDLEEQAQLAALLLYPMPSRPTAQWRSRVHRRGYQAVCRLAALERGARLHALSARKAEARTECVRIELAAQ